MKIDSSKLLRWGGVAIAATIAVIQQISEYKEADRIDDIERRIETLENDDKE